MAIKVGIGNKKMALECFLTYKYYFLEERTSMGEECAEGA